MNKETHPSDRRVTDFRESVDRLRRALEITDPSSRSKALRAYFFPNPTRRYERVFVLINALIALLSVIPIAANLQHEPHPVRIGLGCVIAAFFFADLLSAFFHKFLDSFACESNPWWGTAARAFRIHHEFPQNLETSYLHNVSAFAPFIFILYILFGTAVACVDLPASVTFVLWVMILLFANGTEIHRRSHSRNPPFGFRVLQSSKFFLTKKSHLRHHSGSHNSDYGIINGWSNGLLNHLHVWIALDLFAWRILHIFPRNWTHDPASLPTQVLAELVKNPEKIPEQMRIYREVYPRRSLGPSQILFEESDGRNPSLRIPARCPKSASAGPRRKR